MAKSHSAFGRLELLAISCLSLLIPVTSIADTTPSFSGQATAVRATVLGINTVISDTGPLPSSGGAQQASLLSASVPGLLTADVLHATAIAQASASNSHASVADLNLTVGSISVSASVLMAKALARCVVVTPVDPPAVAGSSQIAALTINGGPIAVSGQPNQTIILPGGRVVINEQQSSVIGPTGDITVNALHVVLDGLADVVISGAHADITCPSGVPPVCVGNDFEVGEGEDHNPDNGDREEHSVACGDRQESSGADQEAAAGTRLWGHLEFIRHGLNPLRVHATRITRFVRVDDFTRHIEGECEINGEPGHTFAADMEDNHERGRPDRFRMSDDRGDTGGNDLEHGDEEKEEPCDP